MRGELLFAVLALSVMLDKFDFEGLLDGGACEDLFLNCDLDHDPFGRGLGPFENRVD